MAWRTAQPKHIEGPAGTYDFSWAFVLRDQADATTRLLVRERYGYARRWAGLLVEPTELISFVMSQRMLRGIKERAERTVLSAAKCNASARAARSQPTRC